MRSEPAGPARGAHRLAAGPRGDDALRAHASSSCPAPRSATATLPAHFFESIACGVAAGRQLPARCHRVSASRCRRTPRPRSSATSSPSLLADPERHRSRPPALRERVVPAPTRGTCGPRSSRPRRARLAASSRRRPQRALHYFPDYNRANPYQGMLFAGLDAVDAYPVAVTDVIEPPGEPRGLGGARHPQHPLDDADPAVRHRAVTGRRSSSTASAPRCTSSAPPAAGWSGRCTTCSRTRPSHVWAETQLAQLLADRADTIHALSEITARQASEVLRLDPRKVVVIEHSSYLGRYPQWISREAARAQLGFGPDDKVLVALGGIRPYKGLGRLLDVFHELADEDPSAPAARRRQAGADAGDGRSQATLRAVTAGDLGVLPRPRRPAPGLVRRGRPRRAALLPHPQLRRLLAGPDLRAADRRPAHRRPARPRRRAARAPLQPARRPLAQGDPAGRRPSTSSTTRTTRAMARAASLATARSRPPQQMADDFATFIEPLLGQRAGPPTGDGVIGRDRTPHELRGPALRTRPGRLGPARPRLDRRPARHRARLPPRTPHAPSSTPPTSRRTRSSRRRGSPARACGRPATCRRRSGTSPRGRGATGWPRTRSSTPSGSTRRTPPPATTSSGRWPGGRDHATRDTPLPVRRGYPHISWGEFRDNALRAAREWQVLSYLDANPGAHQHSPETAGPVVTVLMSAQDVGPLLAPTIAALQAQTLDQWELLVLDRGSIDATGHDRLRRGRPRPPRPGRHGLAHPARAAPSTAASSGPAASSSRSSSPGTCGTRSSSPAASACSGPATARPCTPSPDRDTRLSGELVTTVPVRPRDDAAAPLRSLDEARRLRRGRVRGDGRRPSSTASAPR